MELLGQVHWLSIALGTVAYFMLGALWYSKWLFADAWLRHTGIDASDPQATKGVVAIMAGSVALMAVSAIALGVLAIKLQTNGWVNGVKLGAFTGVCFGAVSIGISYLYEKRPLALHAINGGYTIVGNILAGALIAGL